ncbi:MAG: hypothetical protein ACYSU0_19365 [Planctomycetota bacterium]|jgi:septal ring factor EnvC (AmiA/AmiB activator)
MRDGMPVVALAVALVAVIVAVMGLVTRDPGKMPEPPEAALRLANRRLGSMEAERRSMREKMAKLRAQLTRVVELGSAGKPGGPDMADVQSLVRTAVEAELAKRLRQKAAEVAAPAPKATKEQRFQNMLAELQANVKVDAKRLPAVKAVLARLRGSLNEIYKAYKVEAQRNAKANAARARSDAELAKVLSPAEYTALDAWRKKSKDPYTKVFFAR